MEISSLPSHVPNLHLGLEAKKVLKGRGLSSSSLLLLSCKRTLKHGKLATVYSLNGTNSDSDQYPLSMLSNKHLKLQSSNSAPQEVDEESLGKYEKEKPISMKVEQVLHMMGGTGESSYSRNSKIQAKGILRVKPTVEEAIREVYSNLLPEKLVVADLGCSSGPNTFLVVSEIAGAVDELCRRRGFRLPEIQFFLNDLPGNDFNNIFRSLISFQEQVREEKGDNFVPFYVTGVPGSFYRRLFPSKSVHFFHSSYCQMWLSRVPQTLKNVKGSQMNKEKVYSEQFTEDFSLFLKHRSKELIFGGRMVLTVSGKRDFPNSEDMEYIWGLMTEAFNDMVSEGLIEEANRSAFNFPFYTPTLDEVKTIIEKEGSFHLDQFEIFKLEWDPFDDSTDNFVVDSSKSGEIVAKYIRAAAEPILVHHFDGKILEELFSRYAKIIGKHLSKNKAKFVSFILVLKMKG